MVTHCLHCGQRLVPRASNAARQRYCSRQCGRIARRNIADGLPAWYVLKRSCAICEAIFKPTQAYQIYCSKACAADARRRRERAKYWADPEAARERERQKYHSTPSRRIAAAERAKRRYRENIYDERARARERYWADPESVRQRERERYRRRRA